MRTAKRLSVCEVIARGFEEHVALAKKMEAVFSDIERVAKRIVGAVRDGRKLLLMGNGGSAADAQHWAAEWIVRLDSALKRPALPVMALTTDSSVLTAVANDIGYENVFARQVEAHAQEGDLVILISTSGRSENLLQAARVAKEKGAGTIGILGKGGGPLAALCEHAVIVPSDNVQHIQEMHEVIGHLLCGISEQALYGEGFEDA